MSSDTALAPDIDGTEDTLIPASGLEKTAASSRRSSTVAPTVSPTVVPPGATTGATVISTGATSAVGSTTGARTTQARTTVLPSFEGAQVGQQERDRYKVMRVLGAGGMGEVSLAQDQDINRSVALKYLHPNLTDAGMLARFVEEIRTIGHLEHPNIVPIHDVGLDEQGRYFFVMKHLEGETLETIIEKLRAGDPAYQARFTYERRAEIVIGMLRALQFAHERGIIHRDIKPANVMVGKHGEVVVMDWGIAKSIGAKEIASAPALPPPPGRLVETQMGSLLGTPLYMSPEQASGHAETMDARSDLYSVTVVLQELMSLEHYLGEPKSLDAVLEGVRTVVPSHSTSDYRRYPYPPAGYIHAAIKGLQKDPAARYASADEMIARLTRILDGVGDICCPVTAVRSTVGHAGRFVDRKPILSLWLAIGLAALLATTSVISVLALSGYLHH